MDQIDYIDGKQTDGLVRLQKLQRSMLSDLLSFAQRMNLGCFLVAGSALGAVRHANMIPWDDDIDVGMTRADYERFVDSWRKNPIEGFYLHEECSDSKYRLSFAKMRKNGTKFPDASSADLEIHSGVFIDIFPFDYIGRNPALNNAKSILLYMIDFFLQNNSGPRRAFAGNIFSRWLRNLIGLLDPLIPVFLLIRLRRRLMISGGSMSDRRMCSYGMFGPHKYGRTVVADDDLFPLVEVQFGGVSAFVPNNCEGILGRIYGDFLRLPPVSDRRPSHALEVDLGDSGT